MPFISFHANVELWAFPKTQNKIKIRKKIVIITVQLARSVQAKLADYSLTTRAGLRLSNCSCGYQFMAPYVK